MNKLVSAVILAAGAGQRLGTPAPKQLMSVGGERIIDRAITPFIGWADQVIVTVPEGDFADFPRRDGVEYVIGGASRTASVKRALEAVRNPRVLIHDAARPFVSMTVLEEVTVALDEVSAAYPVMPVVNTIVVDDNGMLVESPERARFREVQTPQGFRTADLRAAIERYGESHPHLPELVRRLGLPVRHTEGSPWLFKITYAPSLYMAQYYVDHVEVKGPPPA